MPKLQKPCPHPPHRVFWSARRRLFRHHIWQLFRDECGRFLPMDYACPHCGALPEHDGDHVCSCPYRDEDCPDHIEE